ncbi:UbiA prenyltransferase family-domain-containing protein [Podospora australis]|uniref:UbiA prenyltransferase family-domain-containing protein n=1 Tax=Podospora australis TaxID=1536484 RepID=A0AAN6WQJ3_9PEZI|nr:UbiA prenyltransferase family-domain-containing protein [Podospora australis]
MSLLASKIFQPLNKSISFLRLLWDFIESDFVTFAVPNTAFGIFGALSSILVTPSSSSIPPAHLLLSRLPRVLAFNVGNLLVFDLANQRTETSAEEDRLNKPWRPIPQGKITTNQTRRLMLAVIPLVLGLNYLLGAWEQGVFILILSWLYNDLGGGDEVFVREIIISVAYGLFNSGSLIVAVGPAHKQLSTLGVAWTVIVSGVILTTMQVQDLKDQAGDKLRGRKTICLYMGENFSRRSIAFFVCFWTVLCGWFWALGPLPLVFVTITGVVVAFRVLFLRDDQKADAKSWRLWCLWHASLYTLPLSAAL